MSIFLNRKNFIVIMLGVMFFGLCNDDSTVITLPINKTIEMLKNLTDADYLKYSLDAASCALDVVYDAANNVEQSAAAAIKDDNELLHRFSKAAIIEVKNYINEKTGEEVSGLITLLKNLNVLSFSRLAYWLISATTTFTASIMLYLSARVRHIEVPTEVAAAAAAVPNVDATEVENLVGNLDDATHVTNLTDQDIKKLQIALPLNIATKEIKRFRPSTKTRTGSRPYTAARSHASRRISKFLSKFPSKFPTTSNSKTKKGGSRKRNIKSRNTNKKKYKR